jgi:hypothetical protein
VVLLSCQARRPVSDNNATFPAGVNHHFCRTYISAGAASRATLTLGVLRLVGVIFPCTASPLTYATLRFCRFLHILLKSVFSSPGRPWSMMDRMSPGLSPSDCQRSHEHIEGASVDTFYLSYLCSILSLLPVRPHRFCRVPRRLVALRRRARRQHVRMSTRALTCTRSKSAMQHGCVACVAADTRRPRSMAMRISKTCTCDDDVGFCGRCRCRRPSVAVADGSFCCFCTGRASGLARRFLRS